LYFVSHSAGPFSCCPLTLVVFCIRNITGHSRWRHSALHLQLSFYH
jgi:hypothetical protein